MLRRLASTPSRSLPTDSSRNRPARRVSDSGVRRLARFGLSAVTLGLMAAWSIACGDGNGGGSDGATGTGGGPGGTAGTSSRLELFQASIDGIDPRDPSVVVSIDPNGVELDESQNFVGALPAIVGPLSDPRVEFVVYPRNDGTLARVSTDASAGTPVPERLSSETSVLPLCDGYVGPDFVDVQATRFAYARGRGDCDSLSFDWFVVSLSDDASTPAQTFPGEPVTALIDPDTGAHAGWLSIEDSILQRRAPNLSTEVDVLLRSVSRGELIGATADGYLFLDLDSALFGFDPRTNDLTDFDVPFASPFSSARLQVSVGSDYAFVHDDTQLLRAAPGGDVLVIDAPSDAVAAPLLGLSRLISAGANRVAWSYLSDADGSSQTTDDQMLVIRSVDFEGLNGSDLDMLPPDLSSILFTVPFISAASAEWVFYQSISASPQSAQAVAARLDGTDIQRFDDAFWSGTSIAGLNGVAEWGLASRINRLDGYSDLANPRNNTFTLTSVDANDPATTPIRLGELPPGNDFIFTLPGFGPERLGVVFSDSGSSAPQTDILYWLDDTPDSLRRVTNTSDVNEFPAALF